MSSGIRSALRSSGNSSFVESFELSQRFAHQIAGAAVAVDQGAPTLKRSQGVVPHAQLEVALGFFFRSSQLYSIA